MSLLKTKVINNITELQLENNLFLVSVKNVQNNVANQFQNFQIKEIKDSIKKQKEVNLSKTFFEALIMTMLMKTIVGPFVASAVTKSLEKIIKSRAFYIAFAKSDTKKLVGLTDEVLRTLNKNDVRTFYNDFANVLNSDNFSKALTESAITATGKVISGAGEKVTIVYKRFQRSGSDWEELPDYMPIVINIQAEMDKQITLNNKIMEKLKNHIMFADIDDDGLHIINENLIKILGEKRYNPTIINPFIAKYFEMKIWAGTMDTEIRYFDGVSRTGKFTLFGRSLYLTEYAIKNFIPLVTKDIKITHTFYELSKILYETGSHKRLNNQGLLNSKGDNWIWNKSVVMCDKYIRLLQKGDVYSGLGSDLMRMSN